MADQDETLNRDPLSGAPREVVDPSAEDQHWAAHYKTYRTAYRYGWEASQRYPGQSFDAVEPELKRMWDKYRHASSQTWEEAKAATRDAWHRVERAVPGDADGDGR